MTPEQMKGVDVEYTTITATITDKWGNVESVYAGSVPMWSLVNGLPDKSWRTAYRKVLLEDRTSVPAGWRVTFSAEPELVEA